MKRSLQYERSRVALGAIAKTAALGGAVLAIGAIGPMSSAPGAGGAPAEAQAVPARKLPAPPANGVMGFVVSDFMSPIVPGKDACPGGTAPRLREAYLKSLPEAEAARLRLKENELEFNTKWQSAGFKGNANLCSQPDMFDRPLFPTVASPNGWGLDLDRTAAGKDADTCDHEEFSSPTGTQGIDNQEYRVMGCTLEWRGADYQGGDVLTGLKQFHNSGQWTQVILLKGVDSLTNDPDVEVIYANTPDRPVVDSQGNFLPNMSFTVSDTLPRRRNVLHGRIQNGVLTTDPADIHLIQTWGQGGGRDIRGNRTQYHYEKGRLRLEFQPDGTVRGFLGGYRPIFDVIAGTSIGASGSVVDAGIDCAGELATLRKYADGVRDPKTGKCTAVSSAMRVTAIPAFITDLPHGTRTASK